MWIQIQVLPPAMGSGVQEQLDWGEGKAGKHSVFVSAYSLVGKGM